MRNGMRVQQYYSELEFECGLNEMVALGYRLDSWQMTSYVNSDGETFKPIVAVYTEVDPYV